MPNTTPGNGGSACSSKPRWPASCRPSCAISGQARISFAAEYADDGSLLGTISIEAPTPVEPLAHLRWFITSDGARGTGLGRGLMDQAMAHADAKGFAGVYLTTFAGLGPARHLYESFGFILVAEEERDQWSGGVREQRFERHRADAKA